MLLLFFLPLTHLIFYSLFFSLSLLSLFSVFVSSVCVLKYSPFISNPWHGVFIYSFPSVSWILYLFLFSLLTFAFRSFIFFIIFFLKFRSFRECFDFFILPIFCFASLILQHFNFLFFSLTLVNLPLQFAFLFSLLV